MTTEESASTRRSPRSSDRPEPIQVPEFGHIPPEGLRNTRDLGGMPTADRRTIAPAKLLRSGALHKGSEQGFGAARGRLRPRRRHRLPHPARARQRSPTLASLWRAWSSTTSRRCPARPSASPTVPAWPSLKTASYNAGPHELVCGMYPPDPAGRGGAGRLRRSSGAGRRRRAYLSFTEGKDPAGLGAISWNGARVPGLRARRLSGHEPVRPNRAEGTRRHSRLRLARARSDVDSLFYAYNDYYDRAMAAVSANCPSTAYLTGPWISAPEAQGPAGKYLQ